MLRGIPAVISPALLRTLAEMGHGDTITIGDAYFAASTMAQRGREIRADGVDACTLLDAILQLIPLDDWDDHSVTFMGKPDENGELHGCEMTEKMSEVIEKHSPGAAAKAEYVGRFEFYDLAKKSFAVVSSGELENYGCVILQKGVK